MAIPSWVMWGSFVDGIGDVTPGIPTGTQAGDFMILYVETSDSSPSTPSGWTSAGSWLGGSGTTTTRLTAFYKFAGASETAPTVSGTNDHKNAIIHSFRGVTPGKFWFTGSNGGTGTTTTPSVNPVIPVEVPTFAAVAITNDIDISNTTQASGFINTSLVNYTSRSNNNRASGNGGGIAVSTGEISDANTLPIIAGHRGGADNFGPENILSTITQCAAAGYWTEFDVRESADGTPWLMHDFDVDRTTNGTGGIINLTDAYLNTLIADGTVNEGIPTLQETLVAIRDAHPSCKAILHYQPGTYSAATVQNLVNIVNATGMSNRIIYASWLDGHLQHFQTYAPTKVRLKFLLEDQDWYAGGFHTAVMPATQDLSVANVAAAKASGIDVWGSTAASTALYCAIWQSGCSVELVDGPVQYENWYNDPTKKPQSGYTYATFATAASYAYVTTIMASTVESADTGSGTDAGSIAAQLSRSDTATRTETQQTSATVSRTDAATVTDIGTLTIQVVSADSGAATQSQSFGISLISTDDGLYTDNYGLVGSQTRSDTISNTDYNSIDDGTGVKTPTGLSATALSGSEILLSWNAAQNATHYDIERNGVTVARITTTSYVDSGLARGTTYSYRVRAVKIT